MESRCCKGESLYNSQRCWLAPGAIQTTAEPTVGSQAALPPPSPFPAPFIARDIWTSFQSRELGAAWVLIPGLERLSSFLHRSNHPFTWLSPRLSVRKCSLLSGSCSEHGKSSMCSACAFAELQPSNPLLFYLSSPLPYAKWPSISTQHLESCSPSIFSGQASTLSFPLATTLPILVLPTCY